MIRRRYEPNAGLINFVGGKLEAGETPWACALREVSEETGIGLADVRFAGIVTWNADTIAYAKHRALGMYVFVADFPADLDPAKAEFDTAEGSLVWRGISDVLSGADCYADNLRYFLAPMLRGEEPADYCCQYGGDRLLSVTKHQLAGELRRLAEMPASGL
jgi:8-oxo-dGTP diphosphatase